MKHWHLDGWHTDIVVKAETAELAARLIEGRINRIESQSCCRVGEVIYPTAEYRHRDNLEFYRVLETIDSTSDERDWILARIRTERYKQASKFDDSRYRQSPVKDILLKAAIHRITSANPADCDSDIEGFFRGKRPERERLIQACALIVAYIEQLED